MRKLIAAIQLTVFLFGLIMCVMNLIGHTAIPWVYATMPLYVGVAAYLVFHTTSHLFLLIMGWFKKRRDRIERAKKNKELLEMGICPVCERPFVNES